MTRLEKALYANWIARFGRSKVKELSEGLKAGRSIAERAEAVVRSSSEEELRRLLLEGFGGFFHQTVFLRKPNKAKQSAEDIKKAVAVGESINGVVAEEVSAVRSGEVRCLLMVTKAIEFLPEQAGPTISEDIQFPVAVGITADVLTVQVLTMQITLETWSEIVGTGPLRKLLTAIQADGLYDQALNFLRESKIRFGDYIDYSKAAIRLIKRGDVNTYSGTLEVGTAGQTKHDAVRGRGKKPLRESMPDEFQKLVSARRIPNAEIELARDYLGLRAGSKVALYPTIGKMAFRSNLQGSDPDEFVKLMAG